MFSFTFVRTILPARNHTSGSIWGIKAKPQAFYISWEEMALQVSSIFVNEYLKYSLLFFYIFSLSVQCLDFKKMIWRMIWLMRMILCECKTFWLKDRLIMPPFSWNIQITMYFFSRNQNSKWMLDNKVKVLTKCFLCKVETFSLKDYWIMILFLLNYDYLEPFWNYFKYYSEN